MDDYLENKDVYYKSFHRVEFEITAEYLPGKAVSITAIPMMESYEAGFKLILVVQGPGNEPSNSPDAEGDIEDIIDNALGALYDQFLEQVFIVLKNAKDQKLLNQLL